MRDSAAGLRHRVTLFPKTINHVTSSFFTASQPALDLEAIISSYIMINVLRSGHTIFRTPFLTGNLDLLSGCLGGH
jgi:hypothetical protein